VLGRRNAATNRDIAAWRAMDGTSPPPARPAAVEAGAPETCGIRALASVK
jgi:hypothetical protein